MKGKGILLAIFVIGIIPFTGVPAFGDKYIEVEKPINLRISTLDHMFKNVETFAKMFGDEIEIKEISGTGNSKSAHIFVDGPAWCNVDTSMTAKKQSDSYVIDFEGNSLDQSKMTINLESRWGWDDKTGDPNGATTVFLQFDAKDVPCESMASDNLFEDILTDGLFRIQQKGIPIEKQLEQKNQQENKVKSSSNDQKSKQTAERKREQTELRGPPLIDTDNDGIADQDDICDSYKETYNGYHDSDGCPDQKLIEKPIPAPFVDSTKDPQHYIDRYNNEPIYKEWFDENYPQYNSIYEAVGLVTNDVVKTKPVQQDELDQKEIIPKPVKDDFDKDGIPDEEDTCWKQAEVYNDYIDWDGCLDAILKTPEDYESKSYQTAEATKPIPDWVKNNAKWYSVGSITDRDFAQSITFMIKEDLIQIDHDEPDSKSSFSVGTIPDWVKRPAGLWADGDLSNTGFVRTIQFLVDSDIIKVY